MRHFDAMRSSSDGTDQCQARGEGRDHCQSWVMGRCQSKCDGTNHYQNQGVNILSPA